MRLSRSYNKLRFTLLQNRRWVKFKHNQRISYYYRKWPPAAIAYVLCILIFTAAAVVSHGSGHAQTPSTGGWHGFGSGIRIPLPNGHSLAIQSRAASIGANGQSVTSGTAGSAGSGGGSISAAIPAGAGSGTAHSNIVTTVFWVGEPADGDNGNITNVESTWDSKWQADYGGVDSSTDRNGYLPAGFTPKENPFYFALPYSDIDGNGNRKASAVNCPLYPARKSSPYSWCKNSWIAISYNGKTAYAQWEDAGPFGEDDTAYVFGSAAPKNNVDTKAGLDVSPAVETYLGLNGENNCSWYFVSGPPAGPWAQILSTDLGDNSVN